MVNVEIGELLQEDIANASKIIFENDTGLTKRDDAIDVGNLSNGSAVVLISSEADLPPLIDGFRTLEQDKNYIFTEPGFFSDPILIPAGWLGRIQKSFINTNAVTYIGTSPMFSTLNIDGTILSVADSGTEPGVKSTVTTSAPHGLLDGQFVNITGTLVVPAYSQSRLQVSNVTASTFDIEIVFTVTDTGLFNTGYDSIQFIDFSAENGSTANFMDLTSSQSLFSNILFTRFAEAGFLSPGIIRKAPILSSTSSAFAFITDGLTIEDCVSGAFQTTIFTSLSPAFTTSKGLIITGAGTKRVLTDNCTFQALGADQRPVRVDGATITAADEILFENSPDNNAADEYFDTSAGGLDETDPQVISTNNGIRKDSQTIGAAFINGNAVVTTIALSDTFQDIDFGALIASASLERFTLSNTATGEFTYIGLKPLNSPLSMSLTIRKVGGATAVYDVKFVIDKGAGFVDFADNIILPYEVKTTNSSGTYECQAQLENGDIIKPQIEGVGTSDDIIADSVSINF